MAEQLYFRIVEHPDKWADAQKICHAVVNMNPWRHNDFSIAGLRVRARRSWNAPEPKWENEVIYYNLAVVPLRSLLSSMVIHHTNNSQSILANEQKQQGNGFAALGYHFFIDTNGAVFEGRPLEILGSHAGAGITAGPIHDPDWGAVGIVLQGDYHHADDWVVSSKAPANQLATMERLVSAVGREYSISRLLMHREISRSGAPTVCPGDHLAPLVEKMRTKLRMRD